MLLGALLVACEEPAAPAPPTPVEAQSWRVLGGEPIELLQSEQGERLEFDPATGRLGLDPPLDAVHDWRLAQPLRTCLGPPLAQPPAGDIAAFRRLELKGREGFWLLELSGRNTCHLEGRLLLSITDRQADTSGLVVDGTAWKEGGVDKAREHLKAAILPEGVEVP